MVDQVLQTVDQAARQSDRWLFLATLVVSGISGVWLFRWLVGKYTETAEKLAGVIERNSDALREISSTMEQCKRNDRR